MKTVNKYYLVEAESTEQKNGGIFIAMSHDTKFIKCKVVTSPQDSLLLKMDDNTTAEFIYSFRDKLKEVSVDGNSLLLIHEVDIVGVSK